MFKRASNLVTFTPISTFFTKLTRLYKRLSSKAYFPYSIKTISRHRLFHFYGTLLAVLLIIILKGPEDSQSSVFGNIVKTYIEETSASISAATERIPQFADINSLMASSVISVSNEKTGTGGTENQIELSTIQGNSVMAHDPAQTDYIEKGGFKSNQVVEYTVQPGDLLSFIASDYGVSVESVLWANKIKDANNISPGQVLRIPPVSGVIYKIAKGDTIAGIAQKYSGDAEKILAFNDLTADSLEEGEEIVIPDGKVPPPPVAKTTPVKASGRATAQIPSRFTHLADLGSYFMIPTGGFNWGRIHGRNGVDIANSCGTNVFAAADGIATIVDATGYNGGFGKYIKLIHPNGTETLYAHLTKQLISQTESVQKGQVIGLMGTTGRSTGCHLHFEVHGARNPLAKY